jgi:hypothetical protein
VAASLSGSPSVVARAADDQIWYVGNLFSADRSTGFGRDAVGRVLTGADLVLNVGEPRLVERLRIRRADDALTFRNVAISMGVVALLYLVTLLPTTLLNSAIDRGRRHFQQWRLVGLIDKVSGGTDGTLRRGRVATSLMVTIGAGIYTLPALTVSVDEAAGQFVALLAALAVPALVTVLVAERRMRSQPATEAVSEAIPAALVIAVGAIALSVWAGFEVLFAYGVVLTWAAVPRPEGPADRAWVAAVAGVAIFAISITAWLALTLADAIGAPDLLLRILEASFLVGVEFLLFGMLPLRFLPGGDIRADGRWLQWFALWVGGAFLFLLVIIGPGLDDLHVRSLEAFVAVVVVLAAAAVAFYLWIRHLDTRHPLPEEAAAPPPPTPTPSATG